MAKNVNLDKAKLVVVTGAGVELNLEVDEQNRVVIRMESQEGDTVLWWENMKRTPRQLSAI
jgi:hypothetical protein